MAATDARPVPRKNVAFRVYFPILDADGDLVTGATALDSEISKDGGTFADCTNEATEIATASGFYFLDLTATEMNADNVCIIVKTTSSGAKTSPIVMYPEETGDIRVNVTAWIDTAAATPTVAGVPEVDVTHWIGTAAATPTIAGVPEVDVTHWIGTAAATPTVAGVPEVDVTHWNGTAVATPDTAGHPKVTIKDGAGAGEINLTAGAVDAVTTVTTVTTVSGLAAGAITAAAIATGAIDADAVAADAVAEIRSVVSGTADSGTTTTLVDAARTEADTDYWKGSTLLITSGTIAGQSRLITGFNAATDTITVDRAFTQAVGTNTYEILPTGPALLAATTHTSAVVPTTTTVTDPVTVGSISAGAITAAAIATDAIDADAIAANAIDAAAIATGAITAAKFAAGAIDAAAIAADAITAAKVADGTIDAATFAAGAINAAAIATGAVDADALATDAVNEIRDAVWAQVMSELGAVPGVTGTTLQALQWLFLLGRNKITQTATTQLVRNDADTATIGTSTVSDDATTFVRGKMV